MATISRRALFGLLALYGVAPRGLARPARVDLRRQLLALASRHETRRRERFLRVTTPNGLAALRRDLRAGFLGMIDGLPSASGPPPTREVGRLEADGVVVEKLVYESLPGYFVPALLYRPARVDRPASGILSPCGHATVGKAYESYQILHQNLARRGHIVLTYDPVGQGERSQFWDTARGRSRFDLACGEHCVLGNPLYLLGTNLARYRIWDGIRGLDYLATRADVDPERMGCVGNSGGGTLTAYIAALDDRVKAAVVGCYLTTLPMRMANRIEEDPSADPEQDPFGFISLGIDHAGLLALLAPRPTLIAAAQGDFFPIEGTRATFEEGRRLYRAAGAEDRIAKVEAPGGHGLGRTLREAAMGWFDRWLLGPLASNPPQEASSKSRTPAELRVCDDGQVSLSLRSRPLLPLALESFRSGASRPRKALADLLRTDPEGIDFTIRDLVAPRQIDAPLILCVNGNESPDWAEERAFRRAVEVAGIGLKVVDTRGVGTLRITARAGSTRYDDPLSGVEENLAYNAFLVGESLLAMRVADLRAAVAEVLGRRPIVVCGRRDSALVVCLAAAVEPRIARVAVEELIEGFLPLFGADARPINAASILPNVLRDFGDIPDVLAAIAPRPVLVAPRRFSDDPRVLLAWLGF